MSNEPLYVPMPPKDGGFARIDEDMAMGSAPNMRMGRRFHMDVDEDLLQRMGQEALPHVAERLAESVVHRHQSQIEQTVMDYLADRSWAEPIIREAIEDAVSRFVWELFRDTDEPS